MGFPSTNRFVYFIKSETEVKILLKKGNEIQLLIRTGTGVKILSSLKQESNQVIWLIQDNEVKRSHVIPQKLRPLIPRTPASA